MEMFEQLFMVAAVLGVLCGGLWLLKRKGWAYASRRIPRGEGQPRLEVLDRLALSPHHSLHLVRMADRTLLIGLSPSGCNLIESTPGSSFAGSSVPALGRER
jgi:flagellar biosynthetic protein FliO